MKSAGCHYTAWSSIYDWGGYDFIPAWPLSMDPRRRHETPPRTE